MLTLLRLPFFPRACARKGLALLHFGKPWMFRSFRSRADRASQSERLVEFSVTG
jgi:hypothetical protein